MGFSRIKGWLVAILLCFFSSISMKVHSSTPDFAYPQTVLQSGRSDLERAIASNDEKEALRALINLEIAQIMINTDSTSSTLRMMEGVISRFSDPAMRSLGFILMADIYRSVYQNDRWTYDRREIPAEPLDENCLLWSGDQFRNVIEGYITEALQPVNELCDRKIKDYPSLIKIDRESLPYYPTLYDFVCAHSLECLNQLNQIDNILPISRLNSIPLAGKISSNESVTARILNIYGSLLEVNRDNPAPTVMNRLGLLAFVYSHVYRSASLNYDEADRIYRRALTELYETYKKTEWSGDVLIEIGSRTDYSDLNTPDIQWLYDALNYNISKFPAYWRLDQLKSCSHNLTSPRVELFYNNFTTPGVTRKCEVNMSNLTSVVLDIYDVSSVAKHGDYYLQFIKFSNCPRLEPLTIRTSGSKPFTSRMSADIKFTKPGAYAIVPRAASGIEVRKDQTYQVIRCTDLSLISYTSQYPVLACVNPFTGLPEIGVDVMQTDTRLSTNPLIARIGTDGFADLENLKNSVSVYPQRNNDKYAFNTYVRILSDTPEKELSALIYTSLGIYHPGDSVEFAGIIYSTFDRIRNVEPDCGVEVLVRDAGRQPVDTIVVKSDSFGRVSGKFVLPSDCLTGYFSLTFRTMANPGNDRQIYLGENRFMVSDYKMPEFEVTVEQPKMDIPVKGSVTLIGRAVTYSGFPLPDCEVKALVSVGSRSRWWWSRPENPVKFFSSVLRTGPDGKFSLELSDSLLSGSPLPGGLYTVEFQVTSQAGETQQASTSFSMVKAYRIEVAVDRVIDRRTPAQVKLRLTDGKGEPSDLPVRLALRSDTVTVWSETLRPGSYGINWNVVPSGTYTLQASPEGYDAEVNTVDGIVLYTPEDRKSPVDKLLWAPQTAISTSGSGAELLYAVKSAEQNILVVVSDSTGVISREWLRLGPGMFTYNVQIPENMESVTVDMISVNNFDSQALSFVVRRDIPVPSVKIELESFRDHAVPGSTEHWTLRVRRTPGDTVAAAVMARLYNAALDALEMSEWSGLPAKISKKTIECSLPEFGYRNSVQYSGPSYRMKSWKTISEPDWETYNQSLYPYMFMRPLMRANGVMLKTAASRTMDYKEAAMVTMDDDAVEVAESEEEVAYAGADAGAAQVEGAAVDQSVEPEIPFDYREGEVPLAFFKPMLTTDSDGTVVIDFDLPEANTTWRFNALAFTRDLLGDKLSADIVASKPVMVSPNVPRFVRVGDEVVVESLIMNNSDSTLTVNTTAELFNPSDGHVAGISSEVHTIAPGATATISVSAPVTYGPLLGFRVKSVTGVCSDGEQHFIGVLESSQPVIDSYPFYLNPDQSEYSVKLPEMKRDAKVDLQLCNDPLWYVVAALPGLLDQEMSTPADAAVTIFSSAVAEGLLRDYPRIAEALRVWQSSDRSESALTSMLERNADLKVILLKATPWMLDAAGDTERMTRLSLLFDEKAVKRNRANAVSLLEKLSTESGGWKWITQSEKPSLWATAQALSVLGRLEWLGYMPDDSRLVSMIRAALSYADKEEIELFAKYPRGSYLNYVFVRNLFKSVRMSTGVQSIVAATLQNAIRDWKDYSLVDKATAAILLTDNGNKAVAKQIIASIAQFAENDSQRGMWWPSLTGKWTGTYNDLASTALILEAFDRVEPGSENTERITQWLIMQKEGRDWGSSPATSMIIADILRVSDRWLESTGSVSVTLGGKKIPAGEAERFTGSIRTDLSSYKPSGSKLNIKRTGNAPAWGSVICRYTELATEIEAHQTEAVKITKNFYRQKAESGEYENWTSSDILSVGDRVKVELVIEVNEAMDYVAVIDNRPACLEPVEQLPAPVWSEGICFYRENRDASTRIFISNLPRGVYRISYDMWVNNAGTYTSGIATIQSQYAPQLTAHSSGTVMTSKK